MREDVGDYRAIADRIAQDIGEGRLATGERLPPQRQFAYERGIAVSTASRVYAELVQRGLVVGEIGRGTFVRSDPAQSRLSFAEPPAGTVDLERNYSILDGHEEIIAGALARLLRPDAMPVALAPVAAQGTASARQIAARFFTRAEWDPDPEALVFTGNGRQAIAATMAALAPPGERLGVEAMTYPVVKGIAARLGITLVPLALDAEGLCPESLAQAHRATPLRGVYLQPSLHNPLGITMGADRRAAIARCLTELDLVAIEDSIYGFLNDAPPLASFAPERVILLDSLSKRVAPGLTLGIIAGPIALRDRIAACVRSGGWGATGLPFHIGAQMMENGEASRIGQAKRADAAERQRLARTILAGLDVRGDPGAYHLWLELPDIWRAETYMAAAARRGIAVTPGSAFAVQPGHAPNAVRLALASPTEAKLAEALRTLRQLAMGGDDRPVE
jgi:DNA-binding transcriptional MocR family regulator